MRSCDVAFEGEVPYFRQVKVARQVTNNVGGDINTLKARVPISKVK